MKKVKLTSGSCSDRDFLVNNDITIDKSRDIFI